MFTKIKYAIFVMVFATISTASAQLSDLKLVSSAGTRISNNNFNLDFSVGESVAVTTFNNSNVFSIGYHQPAPIIAPVVVAPAVVVLFPVPASTQISYLINDPNFIPTNAQLLSLEGKILMNNNLPQGLQVGQVYTFNIIGLAAAPYRVRLTDSRGTSRVGVFVKIN